MQLKSTDTYVAFALEVVLSQGKRHDKIQGTGFVHGCIVCDTPGTFYFTLFCHPIGLQCKF